MRRLVVLIALISMASIGACSSDDERLTSEEFLEQGNAICAAGNAEIEEAGSELFASADPSGEEVAAFIEDTLAPSIQGQIDDLEALSPPEELQEPVDEMLADARTALDDMRETAANDPEAFFASEENPFADVNAQAKVIGLAACAEDS